jgi:hypothetical protein
MKFFRWYASLGWRLVLWSVSAAVIPVAILAGGFSLYPLSGFLLDTCIAGVMPGAVFCLYLIGGPHGGGNKVLDALAGVILIIINAIFYRLIFGVLAKWRNTQKGTPKLF